MPSIALHPPPPNRPAAPSPLPELLQTPSGLAILELQGTIHFPTTPSSSSSLDSRKRARLSAPFATEVGRLVFPLHDPGAAPAGDTGWMKRVYLYVGPNQRMTGEVRALGRPVAVIRRRDDGEELEIVEVVRWKVVFGSRPEPVGTMGGQEEGGGED